MKNEIKDYAKKILADHGCDEYIYGTTESSQILLDLKNEYPNGMDYPYIDVANAIIAISKRKPIVKKKWMSIFDTDSCCDGIACDTLDEAKADVMNTYETWMEEEWSTWKNETPSVAEIEKWNYMYWNCCAYVGKYDPETDDYEEYWCPSDKALARIGWKELKNNF